MSRTAAQNLDSYVDNHHPDDPYPEAVFRVGDSVEVLDVGLAQLRITMARLGLDPGPNNLGRVAEVWEDGTILVEFPVNAGEEEEHSQVVPYPARKVRLLEN